MKGTRLAMGLNSRNMEQRKSIGFEVKFENAVAKNEMLGRSQRRRRVHLLNLCSLGIPRTSHVNVGFHHIAMVSVDALEGNGRVRCNPRNPQRHVMSGNRLRWLVDRGEIPKC